jgi:hypothetical protein
VGVITEGANVKGVFFCLSMLEMKFAKKRLSELLITCVISWIEHANGSF